MSRRYFLSVLAAERFCVIQLGLAMFRTTRPQGGPRQRRLVGKWFQLLSVVGCIMLLAVLFFPVDGLRTTSAGWWSAAETVLVIAALAALVSMLGFLLERGERHLAPSGPAVMQSDQRPPVLYLRPFEAESLLTSEEQALARIMEDAVGPLVAVGSPGDTLPPLGAARFYERNFGEGGQSWQLFVREMLLRAQLVFIVPGGTAGLGWEIAQCREVVAPERLAVLVRSSAKDYVAFRGTCARAGLILPQLDPGGFGWHGETDFIGLVAFGSDWTAHFSAFPDRPLFEDNGVDWQERRLRHGLAPILGRLGVTLRQP